MDELKRWADGDFTPSVLPSPGELNRQTVNRMYCEAHQCILIQDMIGREVCPVCLVEEAESLLPNTYRYEGWVNHAANSVSTQHTSVVIRAHDRGRAEELAEEAFKDVLGEDEPFSHKDGIMKKVRWQLVEVESHSPDGTVVVKKGGHQ